MVSGRFEELERRCKKLKVKRGIKILLSFALVFAILVTIFIFARDYKTDDYKHKIVSKGKNSINKSKTDTLKESKIDSEKSKLKLELMIDIPKIKQRPKQSDKVAIQKQIDRKKIVQKDINKTSSKKPQRSILKIETITADKETVLLKNYQIKGDYLSALKLAEYFYKKRDFTKALYWAKNANKLDSTKEDSWIIYAKAKYALGKREDAIESLKTFLNIFYSKRADELLQKYLKEAK